MWIKDIMKTNNKYLYVEYVNYRQSNELEFVNYNQYVSKLKTMTPDKIKLDRYGSGGEMKGKDIKRKLTKEEIETAKTQVINGKEIKEVCKNFGVSNGYLYYHGIKKDLKNVK